MSICSYSRNVEKDFLSMFGTCARHILFQHDEATKKVTPSHHRFPFVCGKKCYVNAKSCFTISQLLSILHFVRFLDRLIAFDYCSAKSTNCYYSFHLFGLFNFVERKCREAIISKCWSTHSRKNVILGFPILDSTSSRRVMAVDSGLVHKKNPVKIDVKWANHRTAIQSNNEKLFIATHKNYPLHSLLEQEYQY